MPSLNRDLAASVLMDALYTTDEKACQSYGVSVRTLQRWRRLLADGDPDLIAIVAAKRTAADLAWANKLPGVLSLSLQAIAECSTAIRNDEDAKKNPAVLHALAGALRICADVHLTNKVIDARILGKELPTCDGGKYPN